MEHHQYTAEGTIEQIGELTAGLHRHRRGRFYASVLLAVAALPFVFWAALLLLT